MKDVKVIKIVSPHEDQAMTPAKEGDIGIDLKAQSIKIVGDGPWQSMDGYGAEWRSIDYIEYDTGVKFEPEDPTVFSFAISNSRVTKMNLVQGNSVGLIDNGYRGTVRFRYKYVMQPKNMRVAPGGAIYCKIDEEKIFKVGDVVGQVVFHERTPTKLIKVDEVKESVRGDTGFGSTVKKD